MFFRKRDRQLFEELLEENKELRKAINVMRKELTDFKVDLRNELKRGLKTQTQTELNQ